MKRRKFTFKNHGTTYKIKRVGSMYCVTDNGLLVNEKLYAEYDKAVRVLQLFSKRYYGEKAV